MSRIGKRPIAVPKEVKVNISPVNVQLEGPKGKLNLDIPEGIKVNFDSKELKLDRLEDSKQNRANHGSMRSNLVNMIKGITHGHKKELELSGIGFRAQLQGQKILLNLGFSHTVEYDVPKTIKISVPSQTSIIVEGADNIEVGQVAAEIRALKEAEPYKGKGIKYSDEVVRRKQGKSVTK